MKVIQGGAGQGAYRGSDEILTDLKEAANRLLAGTPIRSAGSLTISCLMKEAGLPRNYAYRMPYKATVEWFTREIEKGTAASLDAASTKSSVKQSKGECDETIKELRRKLAETVDMNARLASQVAYLSQALVTLRQNHDELMRRTR